MFIAAYRENGRTKSFGLASSASSAAVLLYLQGQGVLSHHHCSRCWNAWQRQSRSPPQPPRFNTYNTEQWGLLLTMGAFYRFHPVNSFFYGDLWKASCCAHILPGSVRPCNSEDFSEDRKEGWAFPVSVKARFKMVSAAIAYEPMLEYLFGIMLLLNLACYISAQLCLLNISLWWSHALDTVFSLVKCVAVIIMLLACHLCN